MKHLFLLLAFLIVSSAQGAGPDSAKPIDGRTGGEINRRIKLVSERIMFGQVPAMTADFILADISQNPAFKRRFTDFSGDISGRYIDVFSAYPAENNPVNMPELIKEALQYQHPDGRFGNPDLTFDPETLAGPQMALLWGNGRLLVGLLKYYQKDQQPRVLAAAKKLGDFMNGITDHCTKPQVVERLKDNDFMGYICFTQLMEGLVLLSDATKEEQYLQTASRVFKLLPPPGNQHSHGYLNTLVGTLMLYDRTAQTEQLKFVTDRYDELVGSPDYLLFGGVPEYFGTGGSEAHFRDEGCSEADFIMLSLGLWKTTGETQYLEKAEHCLNNHLFANQYQTGDFGHRTIDPKMGFMVEQQMARSWWCCNFHGLRALQEAKDIIFTKKDQLLQFNLFFEGEYTDKELHLKAEQAGKQANQFRIRVLKAGASSRLAVRKPSWAKHLELSMGGKKLRTGQQGDYLVLDQNLQTGDQIDLTLDYEVKWVNKNKTAVAFPISGKTQAALFYGPYLMSVDSHFQPFFGSEPSEGNYLVLGEPLKFAPESAPVDSNLKNTYLQMQHIHSAMYGKYPVIVRPIGETTWQPVSSTRVWFTVAP